MTRTPTPHESHESPDAMAPEPGSIAAPSAAMYSSKMGIMAASVSHAVTVLRKGPAGARSRATVKVLSTATYAAPSSAAMSAAVGPLA